MMEVLTENFGGYNIIPSPLFVGEKVGSDMMRKYVMKTLPLKLSNIYTGFQRA